MPLSRPTPPHVSLKEFPNPLMSLPPSSRMVDGAPQRPSNNLDMGEYYSTIKRPLFRPGPAFNACAYRCDPVHDGHRAMRCRAKSASGIDPERSSDWTDCGHSRTLLRLTKPAIPEIRIFLAYLKDTLTNFRTNSIVKIQV